MTTTTTTTRISRLRVPELDEAVDRATALTGDPAVAEAVGIGTIKYADLSSDRLSDYVFDWDRMLALTGNTGPYLQYAYARTRAIGRKADTAPGEIRITAPGERALALELLGFAPLLSGLDESLEVHRLAGYLYGLAQAFSAFFDFGRFRVRIVTAPSRSRRRTSSDMVLPL